MAKKGAPNGLFNTHPTQFLIFFWSDGGSYADPSSVAIDDAGLHATRVVSGRRFVRWDTVPKLLAQQNQYISGLPYDFFFSKSISPIPTTTNNIKASTPTTVATTSTSTPTPSRKRHSYHNSDSDTYSNEMAPPLVPSSSETDASLGINPDNTNTDVEMELGVDVLNQVDKGSPDGSINIIPPYVNARHSPYLYLLPTL